MTSKGVQIFDDSIWDNIRDLGTAIGAQYSNNKLDDELDKIFNNKTLGELPPDIKVVIPAFDLDDEYRQSKDSNELIRSWKPKIFNNDEPVDKDQYTISRFNKDMKTRLKDIAIYTSAAPTFFPAKDGYIDGGVFANNPSMVAIAQAISKKVIRNERRELQNITLLSVGTGMNLNYIKGSPDWGYAQWIIPKTKPLLSILLEGVAGIADYQSSQLLDERYNRLQVIFDKDESIPLDSVKKINRMIEIANKVELKSTVDWIKRFW